MRYLSRIFLHKQEAVRKHFRDGYTWHKAIWEAFPGRDDQSRDFLFRIDDDHPKFRILVLSKQRPVLPDWGQWETKEIVEDFLAHRRYRFQLRANPTMRRVSDRRRVGLYAEPSLREWMLRKGEKNGFAVVPESLSLSAPTDTVFFRKGKKGKLVSVDFQGILTVREKSGFQTAFKYGIGPAKAFGFGMMMLQPIAAH